jgi:hypothetical protein
MLTKINISRDDGAVVFETVSIDNSSNVWFTNSDPAAAHWPTLASNQVGPYQSPNQLPKTSQCPVPAPQVPNPDHKEGDDNPPTVDETLPYQVTYKCKIKGHETEQGTIKVFAVLGSVTPDEDQDPPPPPIILPAATKGQQITETKVVAGGSPPYAISGQRFEVRDESGNVIQPASDNGWGLELDARSDGIWVVGTPQLSGIYNFTFRVDDAMTMTGILQQVQYSMTVV